MSGARQTGTPPRCRGRYESARCVRVGASRCGACRLPFCAQHLAPATNIEGQTILACSVCIEHGYVDVDALRGAS